MLLARGTHVLPRCHLPAARPPAAAAAAAAAGRRQRVRTMAAAAAEQQQQPQAQQPLPPLYDAHCHPQLDPARLSAVHGLATRRLAVMSVSHDVDWALTQRLAAMAAHKVLPGWGIHPWWAHLHASSAGDTWQQLLEAPSPEQLAQAIAILSAADPVTDSGAYATNRPPSSSSSSITQQAQAHAQAQTTQQQQQQQHSTQQQPDQLGAGLRIVPMAEWEGRLRELLAATPAAFVGEIGIDRAAVIPGSKARTSLPHQLELLRRQLAIAAEFGRPVSVHCVRGYGHLLGLFSQLGASKAAAAACLPHAIMLHSYGGSVEEIPKFCKLRHVGDRFFFSFSAAINGRAPDQLAARIAAVPDDRLLLESDQVSPLVIDAGMAGILHIVASARGWGLQEAAEQLGRNFEAFYGAQLQHLAGSSSNRAGSS